MKTEFNKTLNIQKKRLILLIFLLIYIVFLMLKFHGVMDFTGNYDIEYISCNERFQNNRLLMIDKDRKTTWGTSEIHKRGEELIFRFRRIRHFSGVELINMSDEALADIDIYFSEDGTNWGLCKGIKKDTTNGFSIAFDPYFNAKYIKFIYSEVQEGYWPITEVCFYD